ncbi:MAG: CAP domain-containing protein [Eubacteriales bacterium]|nr:CAP domain-containing protein [Eubacteriales bacterium]
MKKLLSVILIIGILLLAGCSTPDRENNSNPSGIDIPDSSISTTVSQTDPRNELDEDVTTEESSDTPSVSDRDETKDTQRIPEAPNTADKTADKDTTSKDTLPSQSSGKDNSTVSTKPTESTSKQETTPSETTTSQTEPTQRESEKTQEETLPQEPNATKADCNAVAQRVLEYVNQYRSTTATNLPGLTGYAQYRSRQIVSNFAHDTADQRAAATALQYGEYMDPTIYGGSGEPYYRANAREAIAQAGYVGTVDSVAKQLANLVKNSPNHWKYIGSSEYTYIGVGVTYESGMWYCTITVASQNTDEL